MKIVHLLRRRIPPLLFCLLVVGLEVLLHRYVARQDAVASMFAAGPHVPVGTLICAVSFIVVRLTAFLVVPVVLTYAVCTRLLARRGDA